MAPKKPILIGVVLGSISDRKKMEPARNKLIDLEIPFAAAIASGHRTRQRVEQIVEEYLSRGCKVFIGVAGMAAHLAGILASLTVRPVIAVPICSEMSAQLGGLDALLSSVQMPPGIPVGCMCIDGGVNAVIFAAQILATRDSMLHEKLVYDRSAMANSVMSADVKLGEEYGWPA